MRSMVGITEFRPSRASSTARAPSSPGPASRRWRKPRASPPAAGSRPLPSGTCWPSADLTICATTGAAPAKLRMAEGVARALLGQEGAVGVMASLGHHPRCNSHVCFTIASTRARNLGWSNSISGKRITTGMPCASTSPPARGDPARMAAHHLQHEHPWSTWPPSSGTSSEASSVDSATYFATEPKPGQQSVIGRSLSMVLGTWMACSA